MKRFMKYGEYLHLDQIFESFYDLKQRFRDLLIHLNSPIHVHISSISKWNLHRYLRKMIFPHLHRIRSLQIFIPFIEDIDFFRSPLINHIHQLERLVIDEIDSKCLEELIKHLPTLPILSSLTIRSTDNHKISMGIYRHIFSLPALIYCQIHIRASACQQRLPFAMNGFSPHFTNQSSLIILFHK